QEVRCRHPRLVYLPEGLLEVKGELGQPRAVEHAGRGGFGVDGEADEEADDLHEIDRGTVRGGDVEGVLGHAPGALEEAGELVCLAPAVLDGGELEDCAGAGAG